MDTIHILRSHATKSQMTAMSKLLDDRIKLAIDVRRRILAGGGALHADCRSALLEEGSQPEDIWGATWRPRAKLLMYDSQINIRPRQGNRTITITLPAIRAQLDQIARDLLG
jgi:hypothetical protein